MLELWRYTPNAGARDWVAAFNYLYTEESAIAELTSRLNIRAARRATPAEIASNPRRIEYKPGWIYLHLRRFIGEQDATYNTLVQQGRIEEAIGRADALLIAAGRRHERA